MLPDVTNSLGWLEQHPDIVANIGRGIERESLRVQPNGQLSEQEHPKVLGSALTHDWIITDFSEALMELVTPVDYDTQHLLSLLSDLHRYVARHLNGDYLWPFSMPGPIPDPQAIPLARYGTSNVGRMKHIYRQGLKYRYGSMMQIIAGIHYNFSLPKSFWEAWSLYQGETTSATVVSDGYLGLIRNYYRFGWIIPYLFGASPALSDDFLQGNASALGLEGDGQGTSWLTYATSLRLSDLGYTNKSQSALSISFNSLDEYIDGLKQAIQTPSAEYAKIGVKDQAGQRIQLNTNILQIENELYAPIRPKRVTRSGEAPSDALLRAGIEYIEVRSLDVNPFSPIGISEQQVRFLDMFLIWCTIAESPPLDDIQLAECKENWNKVISEGRRPGLALTSPTKQLIPLQRIGTEMFNDLSRIGQILDAANGGSYTATCQQLQKMIDDPTLTFSGQLFSRIQDQGFVKLANRLAAEYQQQLSQEEFEVLTEHDFTEQATLSKKKQQELEMAATLSFEEYLATRKG